MMEMPPLPPIPEGDRFYDVQKFRNLGRGGLSHLYEGWTDAIHAYAREYAESCARMVREQERERCIQAAEGCARCHPEDVEMIVAAIRKG